ncbi:integrase arm-type DNA-binding domain-containing protein, partial [bacterium]|nr:integrase arm-type DNA-binding domain-containing protein [bacterium]
MSKLSAIEVRNAKPRSKPYKLSDGHGMYLHVATSGLKTWRYRFMIGDKESTFTLGEYPLISLEKARLARMEARAKVREGESPTLIRKQERKEKIDQQRTIALARINSFKNIALEWVGIQRNIWSKDHAEAVLNTLQLDVFPAIGEQPVDGISPPLILSILRKIESRGSLEIARKVLQRTNAVFRYAVQTGRATYNPASDMKGVLKPRKTSHRPALTIEDLPQFFRTLSTG